MIFFYYYMFCFVSFYVVLYFFTVFDLLSLLTIHLPLSFLPPLLWMPPFPSSWLFSFLISLSSSPSSYLTVPSSLPLISLLLATPLFSFPLLSSLLSFPTSSHSSSIFHHLLFYLLLLLSTLLLPSPIYSFSSPLLSFIPIFSPSLYSSPFFPVLFLFPPLLSPTSCLSHSFPFHLLSSPSIFFLLLLSSPLPFASSSPQSHCRWSGGVLQSEPSHLYPPGVI